MLYFVVFSAPPQFDDICDQTLLAEIGDTIVFVCEMAINPEPQSFALQIPGKEERIDSENPGENFEFFIAKSRNPCVSVLIIFCFGMS